MFPAKLEKIGTAGNKPPSLDSAGGCCSFGKLPVGQLQKVSKSMCSSGPASASLVLDGYRPGGLSFVNDAKSRRLANGRLGFVGSSGPPAVGMLRDALAGERGLGGTDGGGRGSRGAGVEDLLFPWIDAELDKNPGGAGDDASCGPGVAYEDGADAGKTEEPIMFGPGCEK